MFHVDFPIGGFRPFDGLLWVHVDNHDRFRRPVRHVVIYSAFVIEEHRFLTDRHLECRLADTSTRLDLWIGIGKNSRHFFNEWAIMRAIPSLIEMELSVEFDFANKWQNRNSPA